MSTHEPRMSSPAAPPGADARETALLAARDSAFLCDLPAYAICTALGPDAEVFLQGQLSNDVKSLPPGRAQLSAYNTPKGRMLASVLLWRIDDGFRLQCAASIADALVKRLSMFVLRAKVNLANASAQSVRVGVGGPQADAALAACGIPAPARDYDVIRSGGPESDDAREVLRLPGNRFELLYADAAAAGRDRDRLAARVTLSPDDAPWRWLGVRAGIADIEAATQDKYVPQMLNLELVGGVSFTKGCYPGQEIVARAHYRGEVKRRMFLAHVETQPSVPPVLGQEIVSVNASGAPQAIGSVAALAPAPAGGHDVLACLHLDLAHNAAALHLGDPAGPALELLPLPYTLPQAV